MPSSSADSSASAVVTASGGFMGGGGGGDRFYDPPEWRWLVTDANTVGITYLERIAVQARVANYLERARRAELTVPSGDPRVNILYTDTPVQFPYVHEGVRFLFGWREENPGSGIIYVLRFGGIILQVEDSASTEIGTTSITAFDPRQYLYSIPVLRESGTTGGVYPGKSGLTFTNMTGAAIIQELIELAQAEYGHTLFLEIGTVEATLVIPKITFQQGTSIGEAIDQLQAEGYLDFYCLPLYNPDDIPGICATWNVFSQAGASRPNAIFAWDKPPRSLVGVSNLLDGSSRANIVQFYRGQGGPAVTEQRDTAAIASYGPYVTQQFFPATETAAVVEALAEQQLALRATGRQTVQISPQPLRCPVPYNDFDLGDRVPIRWSDRLRQARSGESRVYGFTLEMGADTPERISEMLLSPQGFTS